MHLSKLRLRNWRNFPEAEAHLGQVNYVIGPNASGKSNFLDAIRFLRDIAKPTGGGLRQAVEDRHGLSKLRCLHARRDPEVFIEATFEDPSIGQSWSYVLAIDQEKQKQKRPVVVRETVRRCVDGKWDALLSRPDKSDKADPELLTQTALEQTSANRGFRPITQFLSEVTYLHLVPQLLKFENEIGAKRLESDPFGQAFLERVAKASDRIRDSRLAKIKSALASAVPQFEDLRFERDEISGRPHLAAKYSHHRPKAGWQREDQLSDGTLRLIALFWLLLDGEGMLLLEEPELSLDEDVVRNLARLIGGFAQGKRARQLVVTTHSHALLENPGIDGRWVLRIDAAHEGSTIKAPTPGELALLKEGHAVSEILLPQAHPKHTAAMALS